MVLASTWAPIRHQAYRALWIASLASNLGGWMQDMGAAWLDHTPAKRLRKHYLPTTLEVNMTAADARFWLER